MKSSRPSFTTALFVLAGVLGTLIVIVVLIDRRNSATQGGTTPLNLPLSGHSPTAWATPAIGNRPQATGVAPVAESTPMVPIGIQPAPVETIPPVAQLPQTQPVPTGEVDLPITGDTEGGFSPWPQPTVVRRPAEIPNYNPGQISPQDLAQRMGGRTSLYNDGDARPLPPGWGQTEPESLSGIAPIATPSEFGPRATPRVRSTPPRYAPTPRLPVVTNSTSDPALSVPDPSEIRPTPTRRPTATRIPFQTNIPSDPSIPTGATPPGGRLPTVSNMEFGGSGQSAPTGFGTTPAGTTIRGGQIEGMSPSSSPAPGSVREPRSDATPTSTESPPVATATTPVPGRGGTQLSNMSTRSRAPLIPGLIEDEEPENERRETVSATPKPAPPSPEATRTPQPQSSTPAASTANSRTEKVLAKAGKRVLNSTDAGRRAQAYGILTQTPVDGTQVPREVLETWAQQAALAEEARQRKLSVNDQEVSETRSRILKTMSTNPETAWREAGFSEEEISREWKEAALGEKLARTFFNTRYNDAALRELFQKNRGDFRATNRIQVREIVIPRGTTAESEERARTQIAEVHQKAKQAGADFPALAAQHSKAPTARNGGDLGWFDEKNPAPVNLSQSVADLKAGEVSDPIATDDGWRIWQVVAVEERETTFDRVKDQVVQTARNLAREEALKAATSRHKIELPGAAPTPPPQDTATATALETPVTPDSTAPNAVDSLPPTEIASETPEARRAARNAPPAARRNPPASRVIPAPPNNQGIRSTAVIRPAGPRSTGDAVAALPGAMRAAGAAVLDRTGLSRNEPPASDMTFVNMGGNTNPSVPSDSAVRSVPDLSPGELNQAMARSGSPGGIPNLSPLDRTATLGPPNENRNAAEGNNNSGARNPSPQPNPPANDPGRRIPSNFLADDRSVTDKAADTVKKPVQAVRGAVGSALGMFRRDKDQSGNRK